MPPSDSTRILASPEQVSWRTMRAACSLGRIGIVTGKSIGVGATPKDIEGLEAGSGTPFGGMALPAELNGYPGPRHVLDLEKELKVSADQRARTGKIFGDMKAAAPVLGEKIISAEREMDQSFKQETITPAFLKKRCRKAPGCMASSAGST